MKRLVDEPASPLEERAAQLVQSVGPLPESDALRERVRRNLDRPAPGFRLRRPVLVFLGVLACSASAAAVWGGVRYFSRGPVELSPTEHGVRPPARAAEPTRATASPERRDSTALVQEGTVSKDAPADRAPTHPAAPASPSSRSPHRTVAKQEATHTASASDTVLLQQAVEALRSKGDAARADELLEKYRTKGDGQLAEEALALSIEANLSQNPPKAQSLARSYLSKYPNGRFKSLAERALRAR